MNKEQQAMRDIADGNIYAMKQMINEAPYDKITTGIVKSVNSDKTYNVEIDSKIYDNIPSFISLNINDIVKICSPQNNLNQKFVIGKYNQDEEILNQLNLSIKYLKDVSDLVNEPNINYDFTGYITGLEIINKVGLPIIGVNWYIIQYFHHVNSDGYATEIAYPYITPNMFFKRSANGFNWSNWYKFEGTQI